MRQKRKPKHKKIGPKPDFFEVSPVFSSPNRPETAVRRYFFPPRFSFAMEAMVGIFIGQTSMQESDLEQALPKCAP